VRFLSCEPLLAPVDLTNIGGAEESAQYGSPVHGTDVLTSYNRSLRPQIDLVIVGGESGPNARPMHLDWARSLRDQCITAGVPFFFKQLGEWAPHRPQAGGDLGGDVRADRVRIVHPTGQSDVEVSVATGGRNTVPGSRYMVRIGKKAAGRMLDGRTWDGMPDV
jgi:protein gp37